MTGQSGGFKGIFHFGGVVGWPQYLCHRPVRPVNRPVLSGNRSVPRATPDSIHSRISSAQSGYEGVVVTPGPDFNPDLSDTAIDRILATARNAGIRIVSIEYFGPNHTDPDRGKRATANADFVRALEFSHRLGCNFVGTFS